MLLGEPIEISGTQTPAGGVVLTLDREIQQITEDALDRSGFPRAAAVVLEIGSGAIRACVSRPDFDPNDVAAALNSRDAPFVNRAFSAFAVGSVFKPVLAAAAYAHGLEDFSWTCSGSVTVGGVTFHCPKENGHGTMRLDSPAALANLSFGQGTLTATPLQICAMTAALAQRGTRIDPYLIAGIRARDGAVTAAPQPATRSVISAEAAAELCRALRRVVTDGSGRRAQSETVAIAGKTATAQTGRLRAGEEIYNAWFTGFFPADAPRYAVTVLVEDGGEGAVSCAPLVREIAERITAAETGEDPVR